MNEASLNYPLQFVRLAPLEEKLKQATLYSETTFCLLTEMGKDDEAK